MQDTGTWDLREAEAGIDDVAIAGVMVEYLEWAHGRLLDLYGVNDPPTDPGLVFQSLREFRRPHGVLLLAESDGRPAGIGGPCPVKWCKRDRRHPRVVRFVHAAAVIAGTPSVSMVV
jgi:hypothetical protein